MDDMTAFERQVARRFQHHAGPPRPVNDAAIFTAITAAQSPKWRFQSMFIATKFVVAGAIVALFGGLLLSGLLTPGPSEESVPAVGASASAQAEPSEIATSTPQPTAEVMTDAASDVPDLLPGVDLVTEEVEPGVFRVLSDGVRDLSREIGAHPWYEERESTERDHPGLGLGLDALRSDISVAPDGSVWYFGPDDFYRVGDASGPAAGEPGPTTNGSVSWAPDGTAWLHHDGELYRFADGSWSRHEVGPKADWVGAVAVAPEGPVWTLATDGSDERVRRLDTDGWTDFDPPRRFNVNATGSGNEDEILKAGASGDVWLVVGHQPVVDGERKSRGRVLVQFDGSTWTLHQPPGIPSDTSLTLIDTAADGSVWAYYGGATEDRTGYVRTGYVGRYEDGEWAVFGPGIVPLAGGHLGGFLSLGQIEAASNGDVWLTLHQDARGAGTNCDGIARFDGQSWTQFLAGECVYGLDTADDGTLWLLAGTPRRDDGSPFYSHTYVITPEAVAAAE